MNTARPWEAISNYTAPLPVPESFEVYPNRDSLPFISEYRFDPGWKVREFVRGTLRLQGWAEAWKDIFAEIEAMGNAKSEEALERISDRLWNENAYAPDEPDRVVLCVSLKADHDKKTCWHKTYALDAWGDTRGSAMARLVSVPVSLAVEAILDDKIAPGVTPAPHAPSLVEPFMKEVAMLAQHMRIVVHQ